MYRSAFCLTSQLPLLPKLVQEQFAPLRLLAGDAVLFAKIKEAAKPFQVIRALAILDAFVNAECLVLLEQMRREMNQYGLLVFFNLCFI